MFITRKYTLKWKSQFEKLSFLIRWDTFELRNNSEVFTRTMSTKNLKVLVSSRDYPPSGVQILKEHFTVLQTKFKNFDEEGRTLAREEMMKLIPGCAALVWCSNLGITTELLKAAGPSLRLVSTSSAGFNHCNVVELKKRGIILTSTPGVLNAAVAELTVGLMLAASRRYTENLQQVRSGKWLTGFDLVLGREIRGSTVGCIGLGNIGQFVVKRLKAFEVANFLYCGFVMPEAKDLGVEFVSQATLLACSDYVLLMLPLNKDTRHMINKDTLPMMKRNAILVNTARGELIEQDALYCALKNQCIGGAALDVTDPEPLPKDHKLLTLDNIFITPHVGSATERARIDMGELAAKNVVNVLTGKPPITPVPL